MSCHPVNRFSEHLQSALSAIDAQDKAAAARALLAASVLLGAGQGRPRRVLRAAECAVDIGRWSVAAEHVHGLLAWAGTGWESPEQVAS